MGTKVFTTAAYLFAALSIVSAESIPVYFGRYAGGSISSKGI